MILKSESILMSEVQLESLLRCRDLSVSSEKWLATGRLQARRALPVLEEAGEQKWGKGGLRICYSFVLHFFWCFQRLNNSFAKGGFLRGAPVNMIKESWGRNLGKTTPFFWPFLWWLDEVRDSQSAGYGIDTPARGFRTRWISFRCGTSWCRVLVNTFCVLWFKDCRTRNPMSDLKFPTCQAIKAMSWRFGMTCCMVLHAWYAQNSSKFQYFSHLLIQLLNFFTGEKENRGVVDCDSGKNWTKIMRFLSMQLSGLSVFYVEVLGADAGCKDWLAPVALDCGGLLQNAYKKQVLSQLNLGDSAILSVCFKTSKTSLSYHWFLTFKQLAIIQLQGPNLAVLAPLHPARD